MTNASLYMSADRRTRTHDVNGRIVSTRNRTNVYMQAMQPHARSHLHTSRSIYLSIEYTGPICSYSYTGRHADTDPCARTQPLVATRMRKHVLHVPTVIRISDDSL